MEPNHKAAALILAQIQGEAGARHDYEMLIAEDCLMCDDVKVIQEIEGDEANHLLKLQAILKKYDGGLSASPDEAEAAIDAIKNGIGE